MSFMGNQREKAVPKTPKMKSFLRNRESSKNKNKKSNNNKKLEFLLTPYNLLILFLCLKFSLTCQNGITKWQHFPISCF